MGLSDFERELATSGKSHGHRDKDRDRERSREHKHRHHRSHRDREDARDDESRRRHKRSREEGNSRRKREHGDDAHRHRKKRRSVSPERGTTKSTEEAPLKVFDSASDDEEDAWVEKEAVPAEETLDARGEDLNGSKVSRDAWMQEPSALDVDYVQRSRKQQDPKGHFVSAQESHELKVHSSEVKSHLADLERHFDDDEGEAVGKGDGKVTDEPAQHEVNYTFGDSASSWRMNKLRNIYRKAEETKRSVDDVALEIYGNLHDFDDAREEERELDRRKTYGKEYVGLEKPSGEFFEERKLKAGIHRSPSGHDEQQPANSTPGEVMEESATAHRSAILDTTALNRLKAQVMRAKLMKAPNAKPLEQQYNIALAASQSGKPDPSSVLLTASDSRHLTDRSGEVTPLTNKRGTERGLVVENEDMSIADMVRSEKRSRNQFSSSTADLASRIAKDATFNNDLDYQDENASNLAKAAPKSSVNLRNTAISEYQSTQRALQSCALCSHDELSGDAALPQAPVVSLATRTYLTLATEPELAPHSTVIVPLQHHANLLECDEDEWEELRNFMKSLTRFHAARNKSVLFYENAAFAFGSRHPHAALVAIPVADHLAEQAPAYFKEAILSSASEWSQHKPLIDTLALAQKGAGRGAFRRSLPKEMPYVHVWFSLDGGLGHVVEEVNKWPKGDLWVREVLGGMSGLERGVWAKQGRWERRDRRVEGFRGKWKGFDWTAALVAEA
ncbi:Pre-mRNA-splicing factor cwf19 [Oleoguttula sp. CCFEE 5521]